MLIQGKSRWAKVLGQPSPGYESTFNHWSIDLYVDEDTSDKLKSMGLNVKDKGEGPFISFSRKEFKRDGSPNTPIRVVDAKGKPWDTRKIGNGSTINVNYDVFEYAKGKFTPVILSMQVWELVEYSGSEFPVKEDNDPEGSWEEDAA